MGRREFLWVGGCGLSGECGREHGGEARCKNTARLAIAVSKAPVVISPNRAALPNGHASSPSRRLLGWYSDGGRRWMIARRRYAWRRWSHQGRHLSQRNSQWWQMMDGTRTSGGVRRGNWWRSRVEESKERSVVR